jgi:hypothetical protein
MKKIAIVLALAFAFTTEIAFVTAIAHRDQAAADYAPSAIVYPEQASTARPPWVPLKRLVSLESCAALAVSVVGLHLVTNQLKFNTGLSLRLRNPIIAQVDAFAAPSERAMSVESIPAFLRCSFIARSSRWCPGTVEP